MGLIFIFFIFQTHNIYQTHTNYASVGVVLHNKTGKKVPANIFFCIYDQVCGMETCLV